MAHESWMDESPNTATRRLTARQPLRRAVVAVGVVALSVLAGLVVSPSAVHAGAGASATPTFPTTVTVGQIGVAASIELTNQNTTPDAASTNTVCNAFDPMPCPLGDPGITVIPSCGVLGSFSSCTPAGIDPDVLRISPTATGQAGTSCAGLVFDVTLIDPAYGQLRFTPRGGAHVTLPGANSICRIEFTFDVLKVPNIDQDPARPGIQTVQIVDNTQFTGTLLASARGTSNGLTVERANPAISTVASPTVVIGGSITDTATVTGRVNPIDGATITFNLYGAADPTCAAAPIFTSTVAINADGTAISGPYTPPTVGDYHWIATYNGDANNAPVSGVCGDTGETVTIQRANPAIATVATAGVVIGGAITDTASVTGRVNPVDGATVTFNIYGPSDPTCTAAPVFTSTVPLAADGTATSAPYTPTTAGTHEWIATYNGDANNAPVSGLCSDAGESVTITRAAPAITTVASPEVALTEPVFDTAAVTGLVSPIPGATVTFNLYADGDVTCTGGPIFSSTVPLGGDGRATSAPYTPAAAGVYRWIATYNGDANNSPVSGVCGDVGETAFVTGPPSQSPPLPATGSRITNQLLIGGALLVGGLLVRLPARRRRIRFSR